MINNNNLLVDMVFTWVDGTDDKIIKKKIKYSDENNIKYNPPIRYQQLNEIIFSVKSVLHFIKWINKIYIVTDNQMPPLDNDLIESGKVIIIDHKKIIPKKYLPTFNSDVIESFLYNIEGLSEIFLYNNDDVMHFNYVKRSDIYKIKENKLILKIRDTHDRFYSNNHILNILGSLLDDEYLKRLTYTKNIIYDHYPTFELINNHHTKILRKSTMKYIENVFLDELHKLRKHRFRSNNYIQYLFLLINVDNKLHDNKIIKNSNDVFEISFDSMLFPGLFLDLIFRNLLRKRPKFACLNSMKDKHTFEKYMNIFFN